MNKINFKKGDLWLQNTLCRLFISHDKYYSSNITESMFYSFNSYNETLEYFMKYGQLIARDLNKSKNFTIDINKDTLMKNLIRSYNLKRYHVLKNK